MRAQAERYGAVIRAGKVEALARAADGTFTARLADAAAPPLRAAAVLLATGVVDREPALPDLYDAVQRGLVRHCPVCDGYEARDQRIAVLGAPDTHCVAEAIFLRTWSRDVTFLALGPGAALAEDDRRRIAEAGVALVEEPVRTVGIAAGRLASLTLASGRRLEFDTIYSALGTEPRNELAAALGAATGADGRLVVDEHRQTSVPGCYAVGDLVRGLNQISVAMGDAAIAATAIHNRLGRAARP
jgi:thioredoxin reductase (NADPH)